MDRMGDDQYREQQAPSGVLTSIGFCVSTQTDIEKMSVMEINVASEIIDSRLGFPNHSSRCATCGAKCYKHCEGHFGVVKFPFTILNPYHISEIAQILNKVCPACKSTRRDVRVKGADSNSINPNRPKGCKYCVSSSDEWYPIPKFKVSTTDIFQRSVIIAEVKGKFPIKLLKKNISEVLPDDYWDFIPKDIQEDESQNKSTRRVLSHTQVCSLLLGIDEKFVRNFVPSTASLFLNSFPITPNSHRVTEIIHSFSNGQRLIFDKRTKAYKKLLLRETASQLSTHVIDCLKISKLAPEKSISQDLASAHQNKIDTATTSSGLRWVKDVVLAKRSDHCFRMVVVGNPNIKINEIGIPCYVADRMQVLEHLNTLNMKNLGSSCFLRLVEKGEIYVRREGHPVRVRHVDGLHIGDTIFRPLIDGDLVMINRPPSIHQHSLIGLSVKILPMSSVLSLNPLCCSPFRGDFDGDCLHGYVPQSVETRVELRELVALDRQLINEQSGHNLLSLSHDSLTAAHLITEDGVLLNLFQMQQLQMFCLHGMPPPTIVKSSSVHGCFWTGKQLFSMLLPWDFGYTSNGVCIKNGELISSEGSFWLRDSNDNIFQKLVQHCGGHTLDILHAAQEVLCEWLQMRGLSVSIADLYLSCDLNSQKNLIDEVYYGLQDAEHTCNTKQLMVDSLRVFLSGFEDDDATNFFFDVERLCYEKQKSATLSQASIDTFKQVFKDIQNLIHKYADKDNSFVTMFKAGSKGNLLRIVQHGLCIGLQHSLVPLKFKMPHQLSCSAWNDQKACELIKQEPKFSDSYIPCAVIENSFLTGLNPLECFVHSVTNRESSFSDNADLPGTLSRRIMFFLRDICTAYDGTVRSAYGNQLVQFFCGVDSSLSSLNSSPSCVNGDALSSIAGQPVGSLAACAISEAAYGALDQPISLLQASPLLSLKNVLECGTKRNKKNQTFALFLSKKLAKRRHGFEYGALEVKHHLERFILEDIVSSVMIIFSPENYTKQNVSPWTCHFHVNKELIKRRRLRLRSIIDSLQTRCNHARTQKRINFPILQISAKSCPLTSSKKKDNTSFCITVTISSNSKNHFLNLDSARDLVIPYLLQMIIKGFREISKVDILWKDDQPKFSKPYHGSSGELYLKVAMSGDCKRLRLWAVLMNNCLRIMNMIDWSRSHPDNIYDFCVAFGIDSGRKFFFDSLASAISDIGKTISPEHLVLAADSLSVTGEFAGLNSKGLAQQREHASVKSPFMQASFSTPGAHFVKAAKGGFVDDLLGSVDALAWGKTPSLGTGGNFDILYLGKGHEIEKPVDVYGLLGSQIVSHKPAPDIESPEHEDIYDEFAAQLLPRNGFKEPKYLDSKSILRNFLTVDLVWKLSRKWKAILHQYPINNRLSDLDKATLINALHFHPHYDEKIGPGTVAIKVGQHPKYQNTRCFILIREDGSEEDFSYHKCVLGALEIVAPDRAKSYKSKRLHESVA